MDEKRLHQQLIAAMNGAEASAVELAEILSLPVLEVEAGLDVLIQQRRVTRLEARGGEVRYFAATGPKRIGDLLVEAGQITPEQLQNALAEQTQTGERLGEILIERGHLSKQALGRILQTQRGVPYVDLNVYPVDEQLIRSAPHWMVTQHKVIPLARVGQEIHLAMLDPTDVVAMDTVGKLLGGRVRPFLIHERDFDWALSKFFGLGKRVGESLLQVSPEELQERQSEAVTVEDSTEEAPIIRVFNSILNEAIRSGATDVHLEPDVDVARVRFRVDGILYEKTALPPAVASAVTSRLKVLAGLDIAERLRPQDGRILVEQDGRQYDLRIATVGTAFGERAAVRLLNNRQVLLGLERLGLFHEQQELLKRLLGRPYGMILVTGPTGSGKTTTLYAAISHINEPSRNIITIEDPVEYRLPGITQIPVRDKAGISFEAGLRSILRHDPDVVVVGEIRDPQTASLGGHAALTGHLVLTTLHTSSAASALIRLLDMGLEPLVLTSSVLAVVGQRLVRVLCSNCKRPYQERRDEILRMLKLSSTGTEQRPMLFNAPGCADCNNLGYKGRTGVFEILTMTDEVRQAVLQRKPASAVTDLVQAAGLQSLRDAAIQKVLEGTTSIDEFQRLIMTEVS